MVLAVTGQRKCDVADVNAGSYGGSAWTRPATVPARSTAALETSYTHDATGNVATVTYPKGLITATIYDGLNHTIKTVANFTGGTPTDSSDQMTTYGYDGDNNLTSETAVMPSGETS